MYRVARRLVDAIKQSGQTQTALCVAAGIDPTHLSKYLAGVTFGAVPADRLRRLGALVGVDLAVVPEDLVASDEALAEQFSAYVIVYDRRIGRAYVGDPAAGDLVTV